MQRYPLGNTPPSMRSGFSSQQPPTVPPTWGDQTIIPPLQNPIPRQVPVQVPRSPTVAQVHPKVAVTLDEHPELHHDAVLFVRGILNEAIRQGASDIHFEPRRTEYRIRFRIDGVLRDFTQRPIDEYSITVNAVKVLADLDIAEHALPQDGHLELVLQQVMPSTGEGRRAAIPVTSAAEDSYFDVRVSVFPSVNGEVIVMRVLSRASALLSVRELGMDEVSLERLHKILLTSYGMILVTGPTGSGKTTTLYSLLSELQSEEKNIITLEDPIEFHLDWMRQCEIREQRGFTFERAMSSVLRQDPDVLMVGEIRDAATAEYAVRSALVGHLVGSTIHANTTVGTIARLLDLGITRSLLAHSIHGIIAQRLVRKVCEHCKERYEPSELHLNHFGLTGAQGPYYRGRGCEQCSNTGFKGRAGIFSVMLFTDEIRSMIFDQKSLVEVQELAIQQGMRTLKTDAALKILAGMTTVEEAVHVV
jgi:type II secretory ATPase GspE/PulE/Tfp pilus assembly ATPase PilB-like protein